MLTAVGIGVLLGRFLFSYLLVFVILLMMSKFRFKQAVSRLHSWKALLAVFLIFLLPLLATMGQRL
ncbi:MAG: hypothetical protein ACRBHB_01205 [Arenicella sp.]